VHHDLDQVEVIIIGDIVVIGEDIIVHGIAAGGTGIGGGDIRTVDGIMLQSIGEVELFLV
jgi:hypothetical protein